MRTFREPSLYGVIKRAHYDSGRAMRRMPDVLYIPMMCPPGGSTDCTWEIDYISTTSTSYKICAYLYQATLAVSACLNVRIFFGSSIAGKNAYCRLVQGAGTVLKEWTSAAAPAAATISFPSFTLDDGENLRFELKAEAGGGSKVIIGPVFLSSRPWYAF